MIQNLHTLPNFDDRLSYLYVEHAVVDRQDKAIAVHNADGTTPVPAASLAVLMLGPGTKITHAAVRALADNNCLVVWCGEQGVRFYAEGLGGSRHSRNLLRQARLASDDLTRLQVVVRMYCLRFDEPVDPGLSLQQLRGKEGVRVRQAYADASAATGVPWQGRSYKRDTWDHADPVNRALSAANACLYGLCHAAILSAGYSPAIGFIHTGKQLSFVYDVADLYKAEFTIPIAFAAVAESIGEIERRVRYACRDRFYQQRLMQRILPDIRTCLDVTAPDLADEFADDPARPAGLWEPQAVSSQTPIGRILKIGNERLRTPPRRKPDAGDDPGEGQSLSAG